MPRFANTEYLLYAWFLIPAALILILYVQWRCKRLGAIASGAFLKTILPGAGNRYSLASGILILAACGCIILALANPVGVSKPVKGKVKKLDIVIALDVSKSMDAQDVKPSRLERASQFIEDLTSRLSGDRIGLVVFAGSAYVQMPLTTDVNALKLFLANVNTNMINNQGTAIGDAIETSKELLFPAGSIPGKDPASKVILLFTDGENHDDDAVKAAREASRSGVIIYSIGVGSQDGAPIPVYSGDILQGYMKDANNETVISKLDPDALREIASQAHGLFYRLTEGDNLGYALQNKLNQIATGEQEFDMPDLNATHFQWFAGLALFLLVFESGLSERVKNKKRIYEGNR